MTYPQKCYASHDLLDYTIDMFKAYARLGMVDLSKITLRGYQETSGDKVVKYHSTQCCLLQNAGPEPAFTEISLKDFIDNDAASGTCIFHAGADGLGKGIWAFVGDNAPLGYVERDSERLSLQDRSQNLKKLRESIASISDNLGEGYDQLLENLKDFLHLREKAFQAELALPENNAMLLEHCAESLASIMTPFTFQGQGESHDQLNAILKKNKENLRTELLASDSFVTLPRKKAYQKEKFIDTGDLSILCLTRWEGNYENILSVPLVFFEWLLSISDEKEADLVITSGRPSGNVLETTSRLYAPSQDGAYPTLKAAYQAALALEE